MSGRLRTLADIIGPAAPRGPASPEHWGLLALWLVAVSLAAVALTLWVRSTEMRRLRRRVRGLKREHRAGRLSERETAYRLASELARALRMTRITVGVPPPQLASSEIVRWEEFVGQLDMLRYQPGTGEQRHGDIGALLAWVQGGFAGWR